MMGLSALLSLEGRRVGEISNARWRKCKYQVLLSIFLRFILMMEFEISATWPTGSRKVLHFSVSIILKEFSFFESKDGLDSEIPVHPVRSILNIKMDQNSDFTLEFFDNDCRLL